MITFKSNEDLQKLSPTEPVYPVMKELVELLIDVYTKPGQPYNAKDYGYLVLIEEGDADIVIDLPEIQCKLVDVLWEGAAMRDGFYYTIYLANDDFGIGFLIPDADWVKGSLKELLLELVSY